jgi:hypothetical protein
MALSLLVGAALVYGGHPDIGSPLLTFVVGLMFKSPLGQEAQ